MPAVLVLLLALALQSCAPQLAPESFRKQVFGPCVRAEPTPSLYAGVTPNEVYWCDYRKEWASPSEPKLVSTDKRVVFRGSKWDSRMHCNPEILNPFGFDRDEALMTVNSDGTLEPALICGRAPSVPVGGLDVSPPQTIFIYGN